MGPDGNNSAPPARLLRPSRHFPARSEQICCLGGNRRKIKQKFDVNQPRDSQIFPTAPSEPLLSLLGKLVFHQLDIWLEARPHPPGCYDDTTVLNVTKLFFR